MANKSGPQKGTQAECMLELGRGMTCYAKLINLSLDRALVNANAFAMGGRQMPRVGDAAVITLNISPRGKPETLKISSRIAYIHGSQISLNMLTSNLTKHQQELLKEVTQSEGD